MQYSSKKLVMFSSDILMLTFFRNLQRWRLISLWRSSGKFSKRISSFTPLVAAQLYRSACRTCLHDKPIIWVRLPINPASEGNLRMWNPSYTCYLHRLQILENTSSSSSNIYKYTHLGVVQCTVWVFEWAPLLNKIILFIQKKIKEASKL